MTRRENSPRRDTDETANDLLASAAPPPHVVCGAMWPAEFDVSPPRYRLLADALRAAIQRGEHPVGSYLPTEHELCTAHGVSRHTAREALRILSNDGLIARRRGAGTVVTAPPAPPAFVQPLEGVDALLRYARDAKLQVTRIRPLGVRHRLRTALRLGKTGAFTLIDGVRTVANRPPLALTQIVVRADLAPDEETLRSLTGAVTELIAARHGVVFDSIDQEISGDVLTLEDARALHAEAGGPALRTRRWYRLASGEAAVASDSIHPADRFVYAMTIRRREASRDGG